MDYLALGGRLYIGNPKQATISIYQLADEEYQVNRFREGDRLNSNLLPNLDLTVKQIFQAVKLIPPINEVGFHVSCQLSVVSCQLYY